MKGSRASTGAGRPSLRRILHATDFSAASRAAFTAALGWARRSRAKLSLVHVLSPPALFLEDSYLSAETYRDMEARARRDAQKRLDALVARARRAGVRASAWVRTGTPAEQILRAAAGQRAGLIVVGTHGRTGFTRFIVGSVAERVVTLARCPVLTVRGR